MGYKNNKLCITRIETGGVPKCKRWFLTTTTEVSIIDRITTIVSVLSTPPLAVTWSVIPNHLSQSMKVKHEMASHAGFWCTVSYGQLIETIIMTSLSLSIVVNGNKLHLPHKHLVESDFKNTRNRKYLRTKCKDDIIDVITSYDACVFVTFRCILY